MLGFFRSSKQSRIGNPFSPPVGQPHFSSSHMLTQPPDRELSSTRGSGRKEAEKTGEEGVVPSPPGFPVGRGDCTSGIGLAFGLAMVSETQQIMEDVHLCFGEGTKQGIRVEPLRLAIETKQLDGTVWLRITATRGPTAMISPPIRSPLPTYVMSHQQPCREMQEKQLTCLPANPASATSGFFSLVSRHCEEQMSPRQWEATLQRRTCSV